MDKIGKVKQSSLMFSNASSEEGVEFSLIKYCNCCSELIHLQYTAVQVFTQSDISLVLWISIVLIPKLGDVIRFYVVGHVSATVIYHWLTCLLINMFDTVEDR